MTKPRNASYFRNQEASETGKPRPPFERKQENPSAAARPGGSKPKPSEGPARKPKARPPGKTSAGKPSASGRPRPKSPSLNSSPSPRRASGHGPDSLPDSLPGALVNRRAADKLRAGHLWVYASDIESIQLPKTASGEPPALLSVADSRGLLLGTALYSPSSQIALRLISREAVDEPAWLELLAARLRQAVERRKSLLSAETDSCRLCFSEADELPGLVIDKYGSLVILQLLTKGLHSAGVREACVRVLREQLSPSAILERPDPRMRELEGLDAPSPEPLYTAEGAAAIRGTSFRLNGLQFEYDADSGQKTGAFLDQRDNYAAAQHWAQTLKTTGRALDVCTYQGGFALHLARVCGRVTGIDASRSSLEVAERNLEANREANLKANQAQLTREVDWVAGDAFQILREWSDAGEKFDTIVLDPPAFAKTQRAVEGALRGYKELNLRALKMLRPGGLLVTCSCSHHVGWAELEAAVASAALDAGRRVRLLERRGAALDHPVVLNLPETEYLKCLVLQAE
jgi:23S rRNA (cytosine1962-C5)-methyltransferase